jgi:hypothetical protein
MSLVGFVFRCFNLLFRSEFSIPALNPISAPPDIFDLVIDLLEIENVGFFIGNFGQLVYESPYRTAKGPPQLSVWRNEAGEYAFLYPDEAAFILSPPQRRIEGGWFPQSSPEAAAIYLLGPVMGQWLRLHGRLVLHASAVAVDGKAILLVGPAHAGKSTTAAVFASLGYPILSDDLGVLDERQEGFWVLPGYPKLKLWNDALTFLAGDANQFPRIIPNDPQWDKRYLPLDEDAFQPAPLPLAAVYLLSGREDAISIQPLQGAEAMISLLSNIYVKYLATREMKQRDFAILGRLLREIPVRQVTAPSGLEGLPALCRAIVEDVRRSLAVF